MSAKPIFRDAAVSAQVAAELEAAREELAAATLAGKLRLASTAVPVRGPPAPGAEDSPEGAPREGGRFATLLSEGRRCPALRAVIAAADGDSSERGEAHTIQLLKEVRSVLKFITGSAVRTVLRRQVVAGRAAQHSTALPGSREQGSGSMIISSVFGSVFRVKPPH